MRNDYVDKYKKSRNDLLIVMIMTVVNIALMFFESETMFLFSATIPYATALLGFWYQWYLGYIIAGIILLIYLICWILSKKQPAYMIVATVLFALDTIVMLCLYGFNFDVSVIIDLVIHIWVLVDFIIGIKNGFAMKNHSKESFSREDLLSQYMKKGKTPNAEPLRIAEDTKHRVLIEETVDGKHIVFRRVKSVNELVIDGYVYDEYKAIIEMPHTLCAVVDDCIIEVGMSKMNYSYIMVDGELIKKKARVI